MPIQKIIQNRIFQLIILIIIIFLLMIIGVLPMPGGVIMTPDNDALTTLSDAVDSASTSGQVYPGLVLLQKNTSIRSTNLANETDLDPESFIFTMGEFTNADGIETDGTYLRYIGTQAKKIISAIVICKTTNEDLKESLSKLDPKYNISLASNGCINDGIVCCVIIPTKAVN